eukprot:gene1234-32578_t
MAVAFQSLRILRRLLLEEEGGGEDHHIDFDTNPVLWTVLKRSGTEVQRGYAAAIAPMLKNQHLLLVTLLLCNAIAAEGLPLCLDRLADPITAVVLSVSVVLIFGEILPQAVCSRYGLMVGAYSAWFVRLLMFICFPVAWPISKLLDKVLGTEHSALFRRAQLKALVDVHGQDAGFGGTLTVDECNVIRGALDMTTKIAMKSMTPLDKVFMLSTDDCIDERVLQSILSSGHSRIPVFKGGNRREVIGVIMAKELVMVNPEEMISVQDIPLRQLPALSCETSMYDMLRLFETGKSHMALLVKTNTHQRGTAGFRKAVSGRHHMLYHQQQEQRVPLLSQQHHSFAEDGVESIGGFVDCRDGDVEEILDETDFFVDNMQTSRVNAALLASTMSPRLRQVINGGHFTPRVGRLGMPATKVPSVVIKPGAMAASQAIKRQIEQMGSRSGSPRQSMLVRQLTRVSTE